MELFQRSMHDEHQERTRQLIRTIGALPEAELHDELDALVERMASQYAYPEIPEVLGDAWERDDVEFAEGKDS